MYFLVEDKTGDRTIQWKVIYDRNTFFFLPIIQEIRIHEEPLDAWPDDVQKRNMKEERKRIELVTFLF